jgi:hypothetical protein
MKWSEWSVHMLLVRPIRKSTGSLVSCRAAFICVAALSILLARSAPANFPHIFPPSFSHTSFSLAFNSDSDHRQCFDREDSQGVASPSTAPTAPPPVFSPRPMPTSEPLLEIVTDGLHYNRPPPAS